MADTEAKEGDAFEAHCHRICIHDIALCKPAVCAAHSPFPAIRPGWRVVKRVVFHQSGYFHGDGHCHKIYKPQENVFILSIQSRYWLRTAYASILKTFQALLGRKDVRPGCLLSLQTYGAYGANFNLH
jgi:hypothetical protein